MRTRRLFSLAIPAVLSFSLNLANVGASSGNSSQPTWWAKYQHLMTSGIGHGGGSTQSLNVGANVDVSNEPGPQSETSIAINPTKPKQIVAGSNEIDRLPMRAYFSSDGGKDWGAVDLPLPAARTNNGFDFGSDPGVAWDLNGDVFYSWIVVFFSSGGAINGTEMAVSRSADGGKTWTNSYFDPETGTAQFDDKPMITVDTNPASPNVNTVYAAWDHTSSVNGKPASTSGIVVSHSTDGGMTFSAPIYASPTNNGPAGDIAADPFVSSDGVLHVAYNNYLDSKIQLASSSNGGQSFGPVSTIATDQIGFDIGIPAQNSRRVLEYPACGSAPGRLVCSWIDGTFSSGVDVLVASSIDGGASWGPAVRATDSTGVVDHFNQWLAVDPSDGSVNVSFYDTRNDPTRVSTDVYLARSTDGGATFVPNVKVTTAMSNETVPSADAGNQYGDYEGIAALNGSIHPVWTDGRFDPTLGEEVFTAAITVK